MQPKTLSLYLVFLSFVFVYACNNSLPFGEAESRYTDYLAFQGNYDYTPEEQVPFYPVHYLTDLFTGNSYLDHQGNLECYLEMLREAYGYHPLEVHEDREEEHSFPGTEIISLDPGCYFEHWDTDDVHAVFYKNHKFEDSVFVALAGPSQTEFVEPIDGDITSHFGWRSRGYHYGMDIDLRTGDPVKSVMDGVVRFSSYSSTYGNIVVVSHYNGLETYYAHLSRKYVRSGAVVSAGDVLGLGGRTGRASGSHLHFEVRYKGRALDPRKLFRLIESPAEDKVLGLAPSELKYSYGTGRYHIVRPGETLSNLARRYNTSVSRLCAYNSMSRESVLLIGKKLRVK